MLDVENLRLCRRVINAKGSNCQLHKAMEEMAELTEAICRIFETDCRGEEYRELEENFREELADVIVMTTQCAMMFSVSIDEINKRARRKLEVALEGKKKS